MKKRLPTDLRILDAIFERYYETFKTHGRPGVGEFQKRDRASKVYVPIDIAAIAAGFRVDPDIVFGRLYYHLDQKHRYRQSAPASTAAFVENTAWPNPRIAAAAPIVSATHLGALSSFGPPVADASSPSSQAHG